MKNLLPNNKPHYIALHYNILVYDTFLHVDFYVNISNISNISNEMLTTTQIFYFSSSNILLAGFLF